MGSIEKNRKSKSQHLFMRILKELKVQDFKVTVFFWNDKYLLKFEDGVNELTYKIKQLDLTSEKDLETFFIDQRIVEKTTEAFLRMKEATEAFLTSI